MWYLVKSSQGVSLLFERKMQRQQRNFSVRNQRFKAAGLLFHPLPLWGFGNRGLGEFRNVGFLPGGMKGSSLKPKPHIKALGISLVPLKLQHCPVWEIRTRPGGVCAAHGVWFSEMLQNGEQEYLLYFAFWSSQTQKKRFCSRRLVSWLYLHFVRLFRKKGWVSSGITQHRLKWDAIIFPCYNLGFQAQEKWCHPIVFA